MLIGGQSIDSDRDEYGAGLRIDLPGFLILGPSFREFARSSKLYPVNTSIYLQSTRAVAKEDGIVQSNGVATEYGLSVDIFLFNKYIYLTGNIGIHSYVGDIYTVTSGGLGFDF